MGEAAYREVEDDNRRSHADLVLSHHSRDRFIKVDRVDLETDEASQTHVPGGGGGVTDTEKGVQHREFVEIAAMQGDALAGEFHRKGRGVRALL